MILGQWGEINLFGSLAPEVEVLPEMNETPTPIMDGIEPGFTTLWYYKDSEWTNLDPSTLTVGELLTLSRAFIIVVKDPQYIYHGLEYDDIVDSVGSANLIDAIKSLVVNKPLAYLPFLSVSKLEEVKNVELKDGLVRLPVTPPLVFNTTTSFFTEAFNGGVMVLDYLDNVFATNDVTLGYIDNISNFKLMYLMDITIENIHAALLVVGNTLVKVSDYFTTRGNTVYPKSHKTEALMSLLIEANVNPSDIGIVGPYVSGVFKSRLITSRLIKHPDLRVLVHPDNVSVEIYKSVVNTTRPESTTDIIFRGNKPSTLKALGLLSGDHYIPRAVSTEGVHLSLPVDQAESYYQVTIRYPSYRPLPAI